MEFDLFHFTDAMGMVLIVGYSARNKLLVHFTLKDWLYCLPIIGAVSIASIVIKALLHIAGALL